jgi:hypothetical protein
VFGEAPPLRLFGGRCLPGLGARLAVVLQAGEEPLGDGHVEFPDENLLKLFGLLLAGPMLVVDLQQPPLLLGETVAQADGDLVGAVAQLDDEADGVLDVVLAQQREVLLVLPELVNLRVDLVAREPRAPPAADVAAARDGREVVEDA